MVLMPSLCGFNENQTREFGVDGVLYYRLTYRSAVLIMVYIYQ